MNEWMDAVASNVRFPSSPPPPRFTLAFYVNISTGFHRKPKTLSVSKPSYFSPKFHETCSNSFQITLLAVCCWNLSTDLHGTRLVSNPHCAKRVCDHNWVFKTKLRKSKRYLLGGIKAMLYIETTRPRCFTTKHYVKLDCGVSSRVFRS